MKQLVNVHRSLAPGVHHGKRQRPKENSAPLPLTFASYRFTKWEREALPERLTTHSLNRDHCWGMPGMGGTPGTFGTPGIWGAAVCITWTSPLFTAMRIIWRSSV